MPLHPVEDRQNFPRHEGHPLAEGLAVHYAQRIAQQALTPGMRLPSVRDCARRHGISPSTVVAAYDRLQAQGLVEARRQRGYFVREPHSARLASVRSPAVGPDAGLPPPVDATALIRGMFQGAAGSGRGPALGGPGMGTLPEGWLDLPLLQRALRRAIGDGADFARYGDPSGDPGLRAALARHLSAELGIAAQAEQITTTLGATHALELLARTLLQPGDAVLVDEPGWAIEFARLSRIGMRLLPVPRGADGPDLTALARLAASHAPRLYVTTPVLHNPTGHNLSLACAHQLLKLADAHDFQIVEDDTYAWLAPGHAPRLSALDGLRRTVYVSGFSKVLAPGWRVGFAAAAPELARRLVDTKLLSTLTTPALHEKAVAWCLDHGQLRRHAERLQHRLDTARQRVVRLALDAGCRFVTPPQGLFGWLDTGVDTEQLAAALAAQGWLTAPGQLFHARAQPGCTLMRVNFAGTTDARFWRAFAALRAQAPKPVPAGAGA